MGAGHAQSRILAVRQIYVYPLIHAGTRIANIARTKCLTLDQ